MRSRRRARRRMRSAGPSTATSGARIARTTNATLRQGSTRSAREFWLARSPPRYSWSRHIVRALRVWQTLDGIPQRRARHATGVHLEKDQQPSLVALPDLAQHPADSLVHQVLSVVQQQLGDLQRVIEVALPDEMVRGDHRDAPPPDALRARELP